MKSLFKTTAIALTMLSLSACATGPKLAPAGLFATNSYSVPLQQDWSAISAKSDKGNKIQILTMDGPLLNSVYLVSNLKDGDSIMKEIRKENPVPTYYDDLSDLEQVEFLTDTLEKGLGYVNMATNNVAPASFNGEDGIKFDMSAVTDGGLNISGSALMAQSEDGLNVVFYLAPTEYYHGKMKNEVDAMFSSLATSAAIG